MESKPESVQGAFEEFLARRDRGEAVDPASFVARHAGLGPELASAIDALMALESLGVRGSRADDVPERVGPYRVLREIGRGGMGVVLEAVEEPLGRRVALKVLPAEMLASKSARARFRREAELAAKVDHPGIATIFGAGVEDARPWIAMRFVEGRTLASAIAKPRTHTRSASRSRGRLRANPKWPSRSASRRSRTPCTPRMNRASFTAM
jgi:serine/threonine protein kinase